MAHEFTRVIHQTKPAAHEFTSGVMPRRNTGRNATSKRRGVLFNASDPECSFDHRYLLYNHELLNNSGLLVVKERVLTRLTLNGQAFPCARHKLSERPKESPKTFSFDGIAR